MKLFSGTAHENLSREVATLLHIPLSESEVVRFDNSEIRVRINEPVHNETCVVIQPTSNPTDTHLMELFFFCDALRRQEAKKVIAVVPYFGYARQDIQHRAGECVSANVVIKFIESIGISKVYTINIHDEATQGVFSIPYKDISALSQLANEVKKHLEEGSVYYPDKVAIISPDQSGIERARRFADELFPNTYTSLSVVEKKRNLEKLHITKALDLYGDVSNKTAILVDDLTTSGGTLINAANLCKQRGASEVLGVVVHHDFSPDAPHKIQASAIDSFFTTNTVKLQKHQDFAKLHEVSIAQLIADELKLLSVFKRSS